MTDKLKDQDSSAPAATEGKPKISLVKTKKNAQVIINPPEKVDPQRGYNERFVSAVAKRAVMLEGKTTMVLQVKAFRAGLPEDVLEQIYIRGHKSFPSKTELTREQYAMNRVNSFIAGGAAMKEDFDLLPIYERVGMKGSGGAMRPHIKREKSVYNGKIIYHVLDKKGHVKHSTSNEIEAKQHLASKYQAYSESTLSPMKRFEGTKSLVKTYKADTPGEGKLKEDAVCGACHHDPCVCDDSHGLVKEARMSAAMRLHTAWEKQRAKSDASLARTPSSIPKPEPKKEESK